MEKIFVTVVVLYALFVAIYFLWIHAGRKRRKDIVGKGSSIQGTGQLKADIVGKSKFDLNLSKPHAANSEPHTASLPKSENSPENPYTFASSSEVKTSAEILLEELDEVFSDTANDEDNEPMDIDYPLEYESAKANENESEDEEEETEEVEGMAQAALASGVQFENLGHAVRTVNKISEATLEQKRKAGDTLLDMRQTDMFEQLISAKSDAKRIVTDLMTESLSAFYERKDKEAGKKESVEKAPDDFNIRDFA